MKQAILLHGTDGSNQDYFWFADTKNYLENHGYTVWWPRLPNTAKPELQETLNFVMNNMPSINDETIIIGHSSACPLMLSLIEQINTKIKQIILVAGFYSSIDDEGFSARMIQKTPYNAGKIKSLVDSIVVINSDDDPWGCNDVQARPVAEALDATFIVSKGQGHMGSSGFNQPYREHTVVKENIAL